MALSPRLRFEVLRRDQYACRYCGAKAPDTAMTVDHVLPEALGGRSEAANLVAACQPCNAGKTSISPDQALVADVDRSVFKWRDAMARAAELMAAETEVLEELSIQVKKAWCVWTYQVDGERFSVPMADNWRHSVDRWLEAGVSVEALVSLIPIAMQKEDIVVGERWRYFAGCCWRQLTKQQELARQILESEGR
jgi:hypothetical protein